MIQVIDRTKTVYGIGSNVVDVIYRVNRIAGPDEKVYIVPNDEGKIAREIAGGVTLNHLAWARLLGAPTGLFGFQGDDRFGSIIRETMDRHGIDRASVVVRPGESSSFSVIYVAPDAERAIYMARALTAATTARDIDALFSVPICRAAAVTTEISQLPLPTVIAVLRQARAAGVPSMLDVDVPPSFATGVARLGTAEEFDQAVGLADVVKPSKTAAVEMVDGRSLEDRAGGILRRYGARLVAITDGGSGSVFADCDGVRRLPVHEITARDSTGAGDAFFGGMIAGMFYGLPVDDVGKLANACGAACCLVDGAFPHLERSLADVRALYSGQAIGRLASAGSEH